MPVIDRDPLSAVFTAVSSQPLLFRFPCRNPFHRCDIVDRNQNMLANQPGMLLKSSDSKTLQFDFDASCGLDPKSQMHMHSLTITFEKPDTITQDWKLFEKGEAKESHPFTLKRVKAGWVEGFTKVLSETTLGSFISKLGLRTARSYSATIFTRSRKTALMASCHDHSDSG